MYKQEIIMNQERTSEILFELKKIRHLGTNEIIKSLVSYLEDKVSNTNKCYRIPLFEFPTHDIVGKDDLERFKETFISVLNDVSLKVEEESEYLVKIECVKKLPKERLPTLSSLQLKALELYKIREDADEIVKQLVEKQKLTQQEYEELQIVRHYEF